jgi:hypothetical protein
MKTHVPKFMTAMLLAGSAFLSADGFAAQADSRQVRWIEGKVPEVSTGVTWGVPWPRGKYKKDTAFSVRAASGEAVPVQSWPLATWPDGSLKWSAHSIPADAGLTDSLVMEPGKTPAAPAKPVKVVQNAGAIEVDTGVITCKIPMNGNTIISEIARDGHVVVRDGQLVCQVQDHPDATGDGPVNRKSFTGKITLVSVEQKGPVRAVVKIEGRHTDALGREWLPFVVRLYFYAGAESVRMMHTIIYDGDASADFICGLGVRFSVPMNGELYDRHVRFAGEVHGLWAEAVRGLTGLRRDPGADARKAQIAGEAVPAIAPHVSNHLDSIAAFGDFTLFQPTPDSFEIRKRTREGFTWLASAYGRRAAGLGYVGSPSGGLAFGIRNFWQSCPGQLDIRGAVGEQAQVTMWLWSPEARSMDLRPYHDGLGQDTYAKQLEGLNVTYEDYEPGFSTPKGIARTSEMMLWALPATPSRERTVALADVLRVPPQLACRPADFHAAQVFGGPIWGLPGRSTPLKAHIEDQLDWYYGHYLKEVEQRHWYGFWNYGDVMHTYDADRHVWRYDVGGFAWDNSELSSDLWLWYGFLRSGRADIFRMAEAMTRHTGEVDVYHLGRFAGLGSRHNVLHWGDSAKQLRISTVENRRFLYYLTADERTGDLMHEELNADRKLAEVPPGRKIAPKNPDAQKKPFPVTIGVGTDWGAYSSALLTEWERTGDVKCREKLVAGMKSIAALKHGWFSGGGGYEPETGKFIPDSDAINVSHLSVVFGGFEINSELLQLLDVPEYERTWLQYCELYNATPQEQARALGSDLGKLNLGQAHSRLTAYVAWKKKDAQIAKRAWNEFLGGAAGLKLLPGPFPVRHIKGPDVLTPEDEIDISTNAVSQWGLAAIQCLALIGDKAPAQEPAVAK